MRGLCLACTGCLEQRLWALVEAEHRQWIQEGGNTHLKLVRLETSDEDEEGGVMAR